jgi:hypothetical protein
MLPLHVAFYAPACCSFSSWHVLMQSSCSKASKAQHQQQTALAAEFGAWISSRQMSQTHSN